MGNSLVRAAALAVLAVAATLAARDASAARALTFEDRVAAQRAIEDVFWRHRIWPAENPGPKPPLAAVMSDNAIRSKVLLVLRKTRTLPSERMQAELDRMARATQEPAMLRELFHALGDDPALIAETLARQSLAEQTTDIEAAGEEDVEPAWPLGAYALPTILDAACTPDSWTPTAGSTTPTGTGRAVWTGAEMLVWGTSSPLGARYNPASDTWTAISSTNAPAAPRFDFTVVWTGSKLIVWGGQAAGGDLNSGGIYDPATDSWVATSVASAPPARRVHTAAWTGSVMVVWGGLDAGGTLFQSGGRYDPATDTWTPTSLSGAPVARYGHTAIWSGSRMIVWGGRDLSTDLNTGGRYDPVLDQWADTSLFPPVPQGRLGHTAVWTGTRMLVWGGYSAGYLATGGSYDPVANQWSGLGGGTPPTARTLHSAVWSGSKMIVWGGGRDNNPLQGPTIPLNTGGVYDPATGWTSTATGANSPSARWSHNAVWTGTEMIVMGGTGAGQLARYNPVSDTWSPTLAQTLPAPRSGHAAVWTGSEMIVWGGKVPGNSYAFTGGRYVPATDTWQAITNSGSVVGRNSFTAVWTGTRMIVWGGLWSNNEINQPLPQNNGGRYDPSTDTWQTTSTGPSGRFNHSAIWTGTRMIVWGGVGSGIDQADGGSYDPVADSWTAVPSGLPNAGRSRHAAVWSGREMIVWGGAIGGVGTNTGFRYAPATGIWTALPAPGAPAARSFPSAVWTGREMVVWGGSMNTGGRYNPVNDTWLPTALTGAPSARSDNSAVWTGKQMIVWGGGTSTGGRYDPGTDTWSPTTTDGAPQARSSHTAVMTPSEMIVWGGSTLNSGGRYCVEPCDAPTTWNQDADADGYGSPIVTFASCTQPYAHVADAQDCNDWTDAASPGHQEVCGDGIDNDCDAVVDDPTVPAAPLAVAMSKTANASVVSWAAIPFAVGYDVQRGALNALRSGDGDYTIATSACLASGTGATSASDTLTPPDGDGSWYLVRAQSCGGNGSYDDPSASQSGARDAEIVASAPACP